MSKRVCGHGNLNDTVTHALSDEKSFRTGKREQSTNRGLTMPWRHSFFLACCISFASYSSLDNRVNAELGKRSLGSDDADFIKSLAEQLYKRKGADQDGVGTIEEMNKRKMEERRGDLAKRGGGSGRKEAIKREEYKDGIDKRDSKKDTAVNDNNNGSPTPTSKDVVVAPLVAGEGSAEKKSHIYFIIMISACCVFGVVALICASICYYNVQKQRNKAKEVAYMPSTLHEYKTIPSRENDSGKTEYALAISAQKFHFQDEKSKIIAMEKEKDQTEPVTHEYVDGMEEVYETPGPVSMWGVEMENPVYAGEVTPGTTPRQHTPLRLNRDSEEDEEEGRMVNGGYVNGDATETIRLPNGPKPTIIAVNGSTAGEELNHMNNNNGVDEPDTRVNGYN